MKFENLTILYFQIAAAFMMGWDYFVPKDLRSSVDRLLVKYFRDVDGNVKSDMDRYKKEIIRRLPKTAFAFISLAAIFAFLSVFLFRIENATPEIVFILGMAIIITVVWAFDHITDVMVKIMVPFGLGSFLRFGSSFLLNTEKGPFAGIGVLCLLASFFMRYVNLS